MDNLIVHLRRLLPRGLARRVRSSKQKTCTLRFPAELISLILEYLPPESVIAFALTCRLLFVQYFPKPAQLSGPERQRLLEWLEKDIPELYLCYNCDHLHRWRLMRRSLRSGIRVERGPCKKTAATNDYFMGGYVPVYGMNLTYSLARLMTNRHLYGPGHGPSVKNLAVTERVTWSGTYGVDIMRSWTAKIINNSLYLHGIVALLNKKGDVASLREFVQNFGSHLVCPHLIASRDGLPTGLYIPELSRDPDSVRDFFPASGRINSCRMCFTDYQIKVTLVGHSDSTPGEENWLIEIVRWHKLGRCRSPDALEWRNMVCRYHHELVEREDVCSAGMVRREWMGGNTSCAGRVEGTFVPLAPWSRVRLRQ